MTPEEEWKVLNEINLLYNDSNICEYAPVSNSYCLTPMDYIVLDIETTGLSTQNDAIIEVGAVKVHDMEITDCFQSFVNPERLIPKSITKLTGITEADVRNAPKIGEVCMELNEFLKDRFPIVGHNVTFDLRFISAAFNRFKIGANFNYIDTVVLARNAFPGFQNYKLETLIADLDLLEHGQEHRVMGDIDATLKLYLKCRWLYNAEKSRQIEYIPMEYKKEASMPKRRPLRYQDVKIREIKPTVEVIETNNPFFGKLVVFTGELSISREEAMQMAVNCGAILRGAPSGKTDYLVIGKKDYDFIDENGMSTKERDAHKFNDSGKGHIIFLNEAEFMEIVTKRGTWVKKHDGT